MVEESSVELATSDIRNMIAHIACIARGTSLLQLSPVPLSNSNGPGNTASIVPVMRRYLGVQIFRSRLDPKTGFLRTLKYLTNVSDLIYIDPCSQRRAFAILETRVGAFPQEERASVIGIYMSFVKSFI
jgi:hypothetical protein